MTVKLEVQSLYKVFGDRPKQALAMLAEGLTKEDVFQKTGQNVGVKDACLSINKGEIFVIMGLSGSGKSTLVRLLNRLIEPSAGKVLLDGEDISAMSDNQLRELRLKRISMVFQSFALMPHLNVMENVCFGLSLAGMPQDQQVQKASAALAQVGLAEHGNSYPDELSGGMQQRVGLARALAIDPEVLLMDEAFSALDPLIRAGMQDELLQLQAQKQRTIVFISHDLDEAMRIGDRIAIMQGGEVVQVGTPEDILHKPANDYVRSFFRGVNLAQVYSAKDIAKKPSTLIVRKHPKMGVATAINQLQENDREFGYVITPDRQWLGLVSLSSLVKADQKDQTLDSALLADAATLGADEPISEIIGSVATSAFALPVVDAKQQFIGVVSKTALLQSLDGDTSS